MTGDEIDALLRLPLLIAIQIWTAEYPGGQLRHRAILSLEKGPHIVPEFPVPFLPTVADETAHLVQACGIPGFRDQFCPG